MASETLVDIRVGLETLQERVEFGRVRALYNVSDDFIADTKLDLTRNPDATLLPSADHVYVARQIRKEHWYELMRLDTTTNVIGAYHSHLRSNPDSLLPRLFSAFQRDADGRKQYWVVMFNWHSRPRVGDSMKYYNLKGTTCRHANGDRLVRVNFDKIPNPRGQLPVLKDLNFVQNEGAIYTDPALRRTLEAQVQSDTALLQRLHFSDYSLSLRVMLVGQCDVDALKALCSLAHDSPPDLYKASFQAASGYTVTVDEGTRLMHVYSMGLNVFSADKVESPDRCESGEVPDFATPAEYKDRFDKFVSARLFEHGRGLTQQECDDLQGTGRRVTCHYRTVGSKAEPPGKVGPPEPFKPPGGGRLQPAPSPATPGTASAEGAPWLIICITGFTALSLLLLVISWYALKLRTRARAAEERLQLQRENATPQLRPAVGGAPASALLMPPTSGNQVLPGAPLSGPWPMGTAHSMPVHQRWQPP